MSFNSLKIFFFFSFSVSLKNVVIVRRDFVSITRYFFCRKVRFLRCLKILIITIHVHSIFRREFASNWQTSPFFIEKNIETEMMWMGNQYFFDRYEDSYAKVEQLELKFKSERRITASTVVQTVAEIGSERYCSALVKDTFCRNEKNPLRVAPFTSSWQGTTERDSSTCTPTRKLQRKLTLN